MIDDYDNLDKIKNNISGDFLAQDIHEILNQIGEITGEFTNDEVLQNIFRNFAFFKTSVKLCLYRIPVFLRNR